MQFVIERSGENLFSHAGLALVGPLIKASGLAQLIETCPVIIPKLKNPVQHFCEELPIEEAQHFYKLLIRLRAGK